MQNFHENNRLLRVGEVASILDISTASVWRGVKSGDLPEPIKIRGSTRWRLSDVLAVIGEEA